MSGGNRIAITGLRTRAGQIHANKIILGKEETDAGSRSFIRGTRVGYRAGEKRTGRNENVFGDRVAAHAH